MNGNTANYDAENRTTKVSETPAMGGGTETLAYDGVGQRVEKTTPAASTVFVYDALGDLAAEYSPTGTLSKEYIGFGGRTIAIENAGSAPCTTCYLTYDHLGSVRMVTDQNASVVSRHDYLPFGEEMLKGVIEKNGWSS